MPGFAGWIAALVQSSVVVALSSTMAIAYENESPLTIRQDTRYAHVFPTVDTAISLAPLLVDTGPLVYFGGPVILNPTVYAIFWLPANGRLQNGAVTGMSEQYRPLLRRFLADYFEHGIDNNNTQYYQTKYGITAYIHNAGKFGGAVLDDAPYPASSCTDTLTPGNCLTDVQIQQQLVRVMGLMRWTGGLDHIFMMFTSSGEGSCFRGSHCAYTFYCGYHSTFINAAGANVIYTNQYADLTHCQLVGAPSPNGDHLADNQVTLASHELTESITDPLIRNRAWVTSLGSEIGDLCAYNYGDLTWGVNDANEFWNGHLYLLQQEFDNHAAACVQLGP